MPRSTAAFVLENRHHVKALDFEGSAALDRLLPAVYDTLKDIARRQLRRRGANTLCTTDLVHETYLKLAGGEALTWRDRAHFNCLAARAMRQVLVDHARKRSAAKRGGGGRDVVALTSRRRTVDLRWLDLLALDEALDRLDRLNERLRKVVEYRFFGGMPEDEIAAVLDVSTRTVERDWNKARLFLHRELYPAPELD